MLSRKSTETTTGVLFIIATLFGAISLAFSGSLTSPDYLVEIYQSRTQVALGIFVVVIMTVAILAIPIILAPILKPFGEVSTVAYIVLRSLESVAYVLLIVGRLMLISLSEEFVVSEAPVQASFELLGGLLEDLETQIGTVITIFFGLGALVFYQLLWTSRLLPRWLSGWGFVGAVLTCVAAILGVFDVFSGNLLLFAALWVPILINELVLAGWLILKGFDQIEAHESSRPGYETVAN
jgi:hypothetical protein